MNDIKQKCSNPEDFTGNFRLGLAHKINRFFLHHSFKGSRTIRKYITRLLAPSPRNNYIIKTIHGFDIIVNPVDGRLIEKQIYYYGTYEYGTLSMIKACLQPGDVFIDAGASIGVMSIWASLLVGKEGKVFAFEPEPINHRRLNENIKINDIHNVFTFNNALGDKKDTAVLYAYKGEGKRQSPSLIPTESTPYEIEVMIDVLDSFVKTNTIPKVKMLKIDVEGFELEVLKGAKELLSTPEAPVIAVEYSCYHPQKGGSLVATYDFIKSINNYKLFKLKKGMSNLSPLVEIKTKSDLPAHDNLFCFLPKDLEKIKNRIDIA